MDPLPTELIDKICSYLCFHCKNPGVFPNADIPEVLEEKRSLSRFCRVSKRIRSIAQPTLFHYYATGNLPRLENCDISYLDEDDKLWAFLRSLIQRPDLACCIRYIQFIQPKSLNLENSDLTSQFPGTGGTWESPTPDIMRDELVFKRILSNISRSTLQSLANDLIPALMQRFEALLLVSSNWSFPTAPMLSLKILSLQGSKCVYTPGEVAAILSSCPNLETLYAVDWANFENGDWGFPDQVSLPKLTKLVLGDITIPCLGKLLRRCPILQDLEYYGALLDTTPDLWDMRKLMDALTAVKNTLKRFSYAHTLRELTIFDDSGFDERHPFLSVNNVKYEPGLCFNDFEKLEELAIEHAALVHWSDRKPGTHLFTALLPPSIKRLHLMYVYRDITNPLVQLACDASVRFPHLDRVRIGLGVPMDPCDVKGFNNMKVVEPIFAEAGVEVQWGEDALPAHPESLVPGGYVTSTLSPVPTISDPSTVEVMRWN